MKSKFFLVALVALVAGLLMTTSCKKADQLVGTTWYYSSPQLRQTIHFNSRTEVTLEMYCWDDGDWSDAWEVTGACLIVGDALTIVWTDLDETWAGIIKSDTIEMAENVEDQDEYDYQFIFHRK